MDVRADMPVIDGNGTQVGTLDKVVVRPNDGEPTALVMRSGAIAHRDMVIGADQAEVTEVGAIRLLAATDVAKLPPFEAAKYRRPPGSWAPPAGLARAKVLWARDEHAYPVAEPPPPEPSAEPAAVHEPVQPEGLPRPAGSHRQRNRELAKNPYDANPYDVLEPGLTATKTLFERDEASSVNPQARRRARD